MIRQTVHSLMREPFRRKIERDYNNGLQTLKGSYLDRANAIKSEHDAAVAAGESPDIARARMLGAMQQLGTQADTSLSKARYERGFMLQDQ